MNVSKTVMVFSSISGEFKANRIASASSTPGSVSGMTGTGLPGESDWQSGLFMMNELSIYAQKGKYILFFKG